MKSLFKSSIPLSVFFLMVFSLCFIIPVIAQEAAKEENDNQVFFRGAYSVLSHSRGGEVFTDTLGATSSTQNDERAGYSVAAGLDLALAEPDEVAEDIMLIGEIFVEYSRFSDENVTQTTQALLGNVVTSNVSVNELNVTVAPKVRFDMTDEVRPFIIPVGVSFLVNSPPSNDTTVLDIGLHFGAGLDFMVSDMISLGIDLRYTHAFDHTDTENSYLSTGGYLGINF